MTDTPANNTPRQDTSSDSLDRRREPRFAFSNRAVLNVISPPWAITPKALEGKTENINANGMQISGLTFEPGIAHSLAEAVGEDVDLKVEVKLPSWNESPVLKGRIVWVHEARPNEQAIGCSVGILFSLLREGERIRLEELLRKLPTNF